MKTRIPIKHYVMDEKLTWAERYRQLETHHEQETKFLISKIEELEKIEEEFEAHLRVNTDLRGR